MQSVNLTVKQLNMYVRSLLEGDTNLASITLEGEISGFKSYFSSGHWYFTLKDNDAAVKSGKDRIHAAYVNKTGDKIWIITEWDRSVTTVLFPSDY